MNAFRHFAGWAGLICLAILPLGCGSNLNRVEGKVSFPDGKPFKPGTIIFKSVDQKMNASMRGNIGEDGRYVMGTHSDQDGVPEGAYKVLVIPEAVNPDRPPPNWPPIDAKYSRVKETPLEIVVRPGKNVFNITVDKTSTAK